jgi:hypothetical protein
VAQFIERKNSLANYKAEVLMDVAEMACLDLEKQS